MEGRQGLWTLRHIVSRSEAVVLDLTNLVMHRARSSLPCRSEHPRETEGRSPHRQVRNGGRTDA